MTKLCDTQAILLSSASQRDNRSLYPLPATTTANRAASAIATLVDKCLVEERETTDPTTTHRVDGDLRYGVFATDAGLAAIGLGDGVVPLDAEAPQRTSKSATVVALLEREQGATLGELIAATHWLPHTTRAALTGLRKKGHAIERTKRDDQTCYRILVAA